jgi:hypothetical protein
VVRKNFDVITSSSIELRLMLVGAPPQGAVAFIGWWDPNRFMQRRLAFAAAGTRVVGLAALSKGGWAVNPLSSGGYANRLCTWRLVAVL